MKTTSTFYSLLLAGTLCLTPATSGYPQILNGSITGKGPVIERKVELGEIKGLSITNSTDVILTQGANREVRLSGQENILNNLDLTKEGSTLVIKSKLSVQKSEPVKIYITLPTIETISITGSGDVTTTHHFSDINELNIKISGSGDINADLDAKTVQASVSGSGDVQLTGSADLMKYVISGSGDLKADRFKVRDAQIAISGSGDANVTVSGTLKGTVSGSGDISYSGDPELDLHHSGSGSISKRK